AVLWPGRERDGGAMDADEAFAVIADEGQQVSLLRVIHVQVAVGEESHGIEGIEVLSAVLQRLFGNRGTVGPKKSVPVLRASTEVVEGDHRGGDRVVLISFALPNDQEPPLLLFPHPAIFSHGWGSEVIRDGQTGGYH